ncbi:MAG: hypothetical protein KF788_15190 [Piscinibacter sp.]|nr:hypothetical protein [Piscinibacter sp.]
MANDIAENLVDVDELLNTLSSACIRTASFIDSVTANRPGGTRYVVPSMKVSVKLSLTNSSQKVKGVLFSRNTEGFSAQTLSQIDIDIVAVPPAE